MAKLDNDAAAALVSLEGGLAETAWTNQARNSWSKFLVAQKLRTPRDIAQLKSSVWQEWNKATQKIKESYAALKSPDDPAAFDGIYSAAKRRSRGRIRSWYCSYVDGTYATL